MDSKNDIKKRMISAAAQSWGISLKDMQKVDPLIPLLIDACASEIERVSSSIEDVRHTIGSKLMELVTPESLLSPYPARAILYAQPFDAKFDITPEHHLYISKDNPVDEDELPVDIYFTPVASQTLINVEVKYLATGTFLSHLENPFEKEIICKAIPDKMLPPGCIWLGISINKNVDSLQGLTFYFNIGSDDDNEKKGFEYALSESSWSISDTLLSTKTGFKIREDGDNSKQLNLPLTNFNISSAVTSHIIKFYKSKFITVLDKDGTTANYRDYVEPFPAVFTEVFEQEEMEEIIDGKFLWIKVDFTEHLSAKVFDKIICAANCIPIVNRKAEHIVINGRERIKELDADEDEQFFDLKSISCDNKLEIVFEQQKLTDMEGKAFFSLRYDNLGRFNKRNALETIRHLNDVYYEEYAAFSMIQGLEHEHIDELNKAIRPFENLFEEHYQSSLNSMPYIILKTDIENEEIDVDVFYWLTNGTLANGINTGEVLRCNSAELVRDKIYLITPTMGGTDRKKINDHENELRYALLTNNRIATLEDIKSMCYKQFGKYIEDVTVVKDVDMDTRVDSGLRRVIKVQLKLKKNLSLKMHEAEFLKQDLEAELTEKALNAIPILVSIEK